MARLIPSNADASRGAARIDQWLWAVRLFRSRALAASAIKAGGVEIDDRPVKPSREVHSGETVTVRQGLVRRTLKVVGVPPSRVGAKLVAQFCEDLTPESEYDKVRVQRLQHILAREKGSGRPTKRERRDIDRLFG